MSATSRPPSPSLASLSDASEADIENISSSDVRSVGNDDASAATGDDATAGATGKQRSRFFDGEGLVTFLLKVEDVSYRVHKYLLTMHSSYWARELGEKNKFGGEIEFNDVAVGDMDALMSILYHKSFQGYDLTGFDEWNSVLRLATKWEFTTICGLAIEKLEPLASPLQKLVMARAFGVTRWLQPAFVALCVRKESLTLSEAKQLSMEDVVAITATREAARQKTPVVADESEVSAYAAKHGVLADIVPLVYSGSAPTKPTQAAGTIVASTLPPSSTPSLPVASVTASANAPIVADSAVISTTPSADYMNTIVTALLEPDFDLAVSLVASECVQIFVDALSNFTTICSDPNLFKTLVNAILRRGAQDASFIPAAVQLIRTIPKNTRFYCPGIAYNVIHVDFPTFFCQHVKGLVAIHRYITPFRTRFDHITLALRYADKDNQQQNYHPYMKFLGGETIATSLYDERSANLQTFFEQLVEAGVLAADALK